MEEGEFDVRGKIFLVTGGDKGLGLETTRYSCTLIVIFNDFACIIIIEYVKTRCIYSVLKLGFLPTNMRYFGQG